MKVNNSNLQFIEAVNFNKNLINVYLDDAGQSYILEYMDKGEIKEVSCGSYNTNYMWCIEELFGHPTISCEKYKKQKEKNCLCEDKFKHGYCDKCMYADFYFFYKQFLRNTGLIDQRLKINENCKELFIDIFKENYPEYFVKSEGEI